MRNFLEEALVQGWIEEAGEGEVAVEISSLLGGSAGGPFFDGKEWPPRPPKKPQGGESFDSLSPLTPSLNDQGRGPEGPLALDPSRGFSAVGKAAPAAYFVTPWGLGGMDVLGERMGPPESEGQGQGQGLFEERIGRVRDSGGFAMEKRYRKGEEIPLLSAVHRAERVGELVRGSRRHLEVSLPETAGETAGLTLEEVDRAVERDARRYDGGAVFY